MSNQDNSFKKKFDALIITFIGTTVISALGLLLAVNKMTAVNSEKIDTTNKNVDKLEVRVDDLEKECVSRELLQLYIKSNKTN